MPMYRTLDDDKIVEMPGSWKLWDLTTYILKAIFELRSPCCCSRRMRLFKHDLIQYDLVNVISEFSRQA